MSCLILLSHTRLDASSGRAVSDHALFACGVRREPAASSLSLSNVVTTAAAAAAAAAAIPPFVCRFYHNRVNASSGRVVSDHTLFPCGVRRNFAGEPRAGAGVGYVVPMSKGKCNMVSIRTGILYVPPAAVAAANVAAWLERCQCRRGLCGAHE
jgi:hypothetical protein